MARSRTPTERLLGPVKTALQLAPPSVLLKAPAVPVPAYTVEGTLGSMARAPTTGARNPVLRMAGVWGSIARATQQRVVSNPVLTALQLPPPSILLKTPPPELDV